MTMIFVTRHQGAIDWLNAWARDHGVEAQVRAHFEDADVANVQPGDRIAGPLPVQIIAAINTRGGRYLHIEMDLPLDARGKPLSAAEMNRYGARLVEYRAERVAPSAGAVS
jgi:CRISPR-associated protein Csx16